MRQVDNLVEIVPEMVNSLHELEIIHARSFLGATAIYHMANVRGFRQTGLVCMFAKPLIFFFR
jgi:hypothetical protein